MKIATTTAALTMFLAGTGLAAECTNMNAIVVPGAERQLNWCLDDLSTPYLILTNHTDASDWGTLHSRTPATPRARSPASRSTATSPIPRPPTHTTPGSRTRSS